MAKQDSDNNPVGYPPVGFHFSLGFSGVSSTADAAFQEVAGLSVERETETIGEGGQNAFKYAVPTVAKYANLVLKRGLLTEDADLVTWVQNTRGSALSAPIVPKRVFLQLLSDQGQPLAAWTFQNAWPVKWRLSDFNAQDGTVAIETLELAYAGFTKAPIPPSTP